MLIKKSVRGGVFLFLVALFFCLSSGRAASAQAVLIDISGGENEEVEKLRAEFKKIGGNSQILPDAGYLESAGKNIARLFEAINDRFYSQYFVFVDRNPAKQLVLVCHLNYQSGIISLIGADKVSTGNQKRAGFFETPCGVFTNTVENPGYRALGTKNDKGWRGLGVKGSRVWDFGWQKTMKGKNEREIRLLMHATDPVYGEKRLGAVDSQGCIRISGKLNRFLDHFGLLDKEYEEKKEKKTVAWLLKNDRQPVANIGKYLLVVDSGNF
jgi:hypothetical protein